MRTIPVNLESKARLVNRKSNHIRKSCTVPKPMFNRRGDANSSLTQPKCRRLPRANRRIDRREGLRSSGRYRVLFESEAGFGDKHGSKAGRGWLPEIREISRAYSNR